MASSSLPMIEVDAATIATALALSVDAFREHIRAGRVRTLTERGIGDDLGRFRLSFWFGKRRVRIITDAAGRVLSREPE